MNTMDLISTLWIIGNLKNKAKKGNKNHNNRNSQNYRKRKVDKRNTCRNTSNRLSYKSRSPDEPITNKAPTPPHSNRRRYGRSNHNLKTAHAYSVKNELQAKNYLPASNLEQGWVIDSGASAHMTPFKNDCYDIQNTNRRIYLADGSSVICKSSGSIIIPIIKNKMDLGTLKLEDVLIVPNLDRRLFSVNSFLNKGNNWVHFEKESH